jgi:transglutaminase-like putative cysteine protease
MYEIRHFKTSLYVVLLMGITGFAIAAESPGVWILAAGGLLINAWLVKTGRFTPMPRLLANAMGIIAFGVVTLEWVFDDTTRVLTLGQGLIFLQLVKLFEQRTNRDYAQLLVLSFLLMIGAAISTASLLFGLLFIAYLLLLLYVSLLFHLKVEADHARQLDGRPLDRIPVGLSRDQRYLPSSMRRMTGIVSCSALVMAIVVFVLFPRGDSEGVLSAMQLRPSQAIAGFNDNVSFQKIAQITQNNSVIARVELFEKDQKTTNGGPLLLRGSVLDTYNDPRTGPWTWSRSELRPDQQEIEFLGPDQEWVGFAFGNPQYRQVINLQPTGTRALFAMAGATRIGFAQIRQIQAKYSRRDGILSTLEPLRSPLQYTVVSSGQLPETPRDEFQFHSAIDPAIKQYALEPQVCGTDATGQPLGNLPLAGNHASDLLIAGNIEKHLRGTFQYTLDLNDFQNVRGRDPIAAFLTDFKRGHCEYFAGAMTLLCQSLNIPARLVVGFHCDNDDFNTVGNYYEVKQSNAHAWCEVMVDNTRPPPIPNPGEAPSRAALTEWRTFDPTSAIQAPRSQSFAGHIREVFDFLEFKWATAVVAYDGRDRRTLMDSFNFQVSRNAVAAGQSVQNWWDDKKQWVPTTLLSVIIGVIIAVGVIACSWYLGQQWRLRRRAKRIGLESLATPDRARLLKQLGFYDDLLRVLERHRISRPCQLTPLEFSHMLSFLPAQIYEDITRLTQLYYRIRYGDATLNPHRQRRLGTAVQRIGEAMEDSATAA